MKLLYHITESNNPCENLALEELLFSMLGNDEVLLYLWQNDNTVVIGRNQNAWRECRLDAFAAQKGHLVRRLTGGGAMYQDMGNQNFTFFAPNTLYDVWKQTEVIRLAAASFGIDTERSGRNDILADGRKFSGNAYFKGSVSSFHHGTILISSDLSRLSQFLAPSPEKLKSKGVDSVRSRVVNLCELKPAITPTAMRNAVIRAFEQVYESKAELFDSAALDIKKLTDLTAHYADDTWRLGLKAAFDFNARRRFSFGELEFDFSVHDNRVTQAAVHSDALDAPWVLAMEQSFVGKEFSAAALAAAIPENPDRKEVEDFFRTEFLV